MPQHTQHKTSAAWRIANNQGTVLKYVLRTHLLPTAENMHASSTQPYNLCCAVLPLQLHCCLHNSMRMRVCIAGCWPPAGLKTVLMRT
jgi:hypothetical protein